MTQDVPISEDFINAGKAQFDFAWDIVVSFLKLFDEAGDYGVDIEEDAEDYWEAVKQRIQTALAITQQRVELVIKGKIVNINPYLLIAGLPSDWPKPNHESPLSFSDFRTIDAQDLVKTRNIFSEIKLSNVAPVVIPKANKANQPTTSAAIAPCVSAYLRRCFERGAMNEILVVPDQGRDHSSRTKEAVNLANASQRYFFLRLQEQPMAIESAGASVIGVMAAEHIDVSAKDQDTACNRPAIQHAATEYNSQRTCNKEGER